MRYRLMFAVAAVVLCSLTGCGREQAASGPVFGEVCSGYDGFAHLEEATLENGTDSMTLYLPKEVNKHPAKESPGDYCDGVRVRIGFTAYPSDNILPLAQCRDWVLTKCHQDQITRTTGFSMGQARYLTEKTVRIPVSYYEVYGEHLRIDRTYYIRQLDQNTVFFLEVSVSAREVTEHTADILEELEYFYQFDIACNEKYVGLVRQLARQSPPSGPRIRVRHMQIAGDIEKQTGRLRDRSLEKELLWQFPGAHNPFLQIMRIRTGSGKNYVLAALWMHGRDNARRCQGNYSDCRSCIWLLEMTK